MSKPLTMTVEQEEQIRSTFAGKPFPLAICGEVDALRAALAAAEAKLADERRQLTAALEAERLHADWLAKQYRECSVWPSTEEQHAGCECGWMWGYMEHGDFEQEEQHAPECPNAVHAARRAAEARS